MDQAVAASTNFAGSVSGNGVQAVTKLPERPISYIPYAVITSEESF